MYIPNYSNSNWLMILSNKESESETKNTKSIQNPAFCFSCCFTVLVGDFRHSFHGNFLQKATSKLGTKCCVDPRQGHHGREFVAPETRAFNRCLLPHDSICLYVLLLLNITS